MKPHDAHGDMLQSVLDSLLDVLGDNIVERLQQVELGNAQHGDSKLLDSADAARDGIEIVAPLHDAVLILAPTDAADNYAEKICRIMHNASRQLLNGHEVRVAFQIYRDRFEDKDGRDDWNRVAKLLTAY